MPDIDTLHASLSKVKSKLIYNEVNEEKRNASINCLDVEPISPLLMMIPLKKL